ncbi:MAG: MiaB/RimO family radical SAM methylthiotransferase [Patescibacteria group bacterium]
MKYFIKTFGCYANEVDSDVMAGILDSLGFSELKLPKLRNETEEVKHILENADLFIVNTCSVRQKSEDKVYGVVRMLKRNEGKKALTILAGCMVGSAKGDRKRYKLSSVKEKAKGFDFYIGPNDIYSLPSILLDSGLIETLEGFDSSSAQRRQVDKNHAYINVSYGCDNFCSYCVVPYSRGKEVTRSEKEILEEIKCLVNLGVSEITLCGQNVNSWGLDRATKFKLRSGGNQKLPFVSLLKKVHKVKGVKKIDFMSSNPFDFTKDLVEVLKLPKVSNYFHIAVQSGNNAVLKAMRRRHTVEEFLTLVDDIRKIRSDAEFGTDAIVGFSGETKEQFMDTVELFKKVRFSVAFISMYSEREGTRSQKNLKDNVSLEEKKWRHGCLTKVWKKYKP